MNRVTPWTFETLSIWYNAAFAKKEVVRYLSMEKYIATPKPDDYALDWERAAFLSKSGSTLLRCTFDHGGSGNIDICLWSLADDFRRKLECGKALVFVKTEIIPTYRPSTISAVVHASNQECLTLMKRVFGDPWGVRPLSAWDRGVGSMVDMHCFQKPIAAVAVPIRRPKVLGAAGSQPYLSRQPKSHRSGSRSGKDARYVGWNEQIC